MKIIFGFLFLVLLTSCGDENKKKEVRENVQVVGNEVFINGISITVGATGLDVLNDILGKYTIQYSNSYYWTEKGIKVIAKDGCVLSVLFALHNMDTLRYSDAGEKIILNKFQGRIFVEGTEIHSDISLKKINKALSGVFRAFGHRNFRYKITRQPIDLELHLQYEVIATNPVNTSFTIASNKWECFSGNDK